MTPPLKPPWTDTGTHTLELTGQKTSDTASDIVIAMKMLEKDWDSYDTAIYTDCAATQTVIATSLSTLAPQVTQESTVSALSCPANGARPFKPKRAVQTALNLVQEDVSLHKVCIVSDSMSTLQLIQNLHPFQYAANSDENEILNALASPTNRGCHLNFTRCPSHSGVCGNELRVSQRSDNCRAGREKSSL